MRGQPAQDVTRELTVMRASFNQMQRTGSEGFQPLGELPRQQFTKQAANTDASVEISQSADLSGVTLVVSSFETVERDLHEAREGHSPALFRFLTQDGRDTSHFVLWAERLGNAFANQE